MQTKIQIRQGCKPSYNRSLTTLESRVTLLRTQSGSLDSSLRGRESLLFVGFPGAPLPTKEVPTYD